MSQVTRRIFTFNDPSTLLMGVHPSAKNILGKANLAFMHGPAHKVGSGVKMPREIVVILRRFTLVLLLLSEV